MSHSIRTVAKWGAAAVLAGACAMAAHGQGQNQGQGQDETSSAAALDSFNFPENITILGQNELSLRRPTATVNGTVITGTDVDQRVALLLAANEVSQVPEEELRRLRLQVLRNLIDETLQIHEATAQQMPVAPEEVEDSYQRVAGNNFSRSPEQMDQYLRSIGSSPQSLKRQIEGELAWDRLLRRNVAPFVNVSSEEVNEMYDRMQAARGTSEYRIAEIFLSANESNRAAVAADAQRIVSELREGADFANYARLRSESSTAARGGDLGWIKLEQLQNAQLEEVAKQMQPGQMVGPIEIPGGFDIIFMIDKRQIGMADPRDALLSLKQISLDFPQGMSEEDARTRANTFAEAVKNIRGCGEADSAAAAIGAQVVNNDQIAVRALPEALQNVLLELNVGQATPAFGSLDEGVRVLMVCGRDDPDPNAGPDRDQLASSLEDDRIEKRAQRYLRDLRRDAVIDYN
ncbi:MAG TPA: peptidylprolyl isomerase [Croceibacterium sp.]|nr:peptidylprolyl isomerase [Croceibacterium sp.]